MDILQKFLKYDAGLNPDKVDVLAAYFQEEVIPKGEFLVKLHGYCKKLVLIKEGYLRCYFPTEKREVTHWVFWKGQVVTDVSSFMFQVPAKWNYQAIQDCEVYSISMANYRKMNGQFHDWTTYEKRLFIKLVSSLEKRIYALLSMSSEERYTFLFKTHPELFNQIPLTYIASMLNMTPETLSRIRRKSIS